MFKRRRGSLAKRAFVMAKRLTNAVEETKYYSYPVQTEVTATGTSGIQYWDLTNMSNYTNLFNDTNGSLVGNGTGVVGNKYYDRYIKGKWEIHMDNVNNEEETVNFTVAVVSFKSDADSTVFNQNVQNALITHSSRSNGQCYFDPRFIKVHYYKHFARTMGGTSPGTAGESLRWGSFKILRNKMIRTLRPSQLSASSPVSLQDQLYFCVCTDNTSADLENPRMNAHFLRCIKDNDSYNV